MKQSNFPTVNHLQKQLKSVQNKSQLVDKIHNLYNQLYPNHIFPFQIFYHKSKRSQTKLFCYCRGCKFALTYKWKEDAWKIQKFQLDHNHNFQLLQRKKSTLEIQNQISNSYQKVERKNLRLILTHKYKISQANFYKKYRQVTENLKNSKYTFQYLLKKIENDYIICCHPFPLSENQKFPQIFLITSNDWKEKYNKFHDQVAFDLITCTLHNQKQPYYMGFLIGLNNLNKTIIFALAMTKNQETSNFEKLFLSIFEIFGKIPSNIVIRQNQSIISALDNIKRIQKLNFTYSFDTALFLKQCRVHKENFSKGKNAIQKLIMSQNQCEYEQNLKKIMKKLNYYGIDHLDFENMIQNQERIIPIFIKGFTGLNTFDETHQNRYNLLESAVQKHKNNPWFIENIINFIEYKNNMNSFIFQIQNHEYQNVFKIESLQQIRKHVEKKVFSKICQQISKASTLLISKKYNDIYEISQDSCKNENLVIVKKNQYGFYMCKCQKLQKTGIACKHLFKVLLVRQQNLNYGISKRWKVSPQELLTIEAKKNEYNEKKKQLKTKKRRKL